MPTSGCARGSHRGHRSVEDGQPGAPGVGQRFAPGLDSPDRGVDDEGRTADHGQATHAVEAGILIGAPTA